MMDRRLVKEFRDKDVVEGSYLVKEKNVSVGKNGRAFMSLLLGDASGHVDARLWDNVDQAAREFDNGDVIQIKGQVQLFQGRKQLILHRIEKVDPATVQFDDYIPKASRAPEDLYAELLNIARTIKNESIRRLVLDTLEDPELHPLILRAPAAKSIHHAWIGGLIEHIVSIAKTMDFMAGHFPFLNRDLLIFGAIFHDIGKIWELSWEQGIGYTNRGRLIGHMEMGCELVDRKAARILGFDPDLRDILKHIILAHHGKLEYGSPKRPKFLEALVVAMVDDMDSKIASVRSLIENERGGTEQWSRYNELYERYFLLDDLKAKFE